MFAYCRNNAVCRVDVSGTADQDCVDDSPLDDEDILKYSSGGGGFWDSLVRTMQSAADGLSMAMGNRTLPSSGLTHQPATQKNPLRNITYTDKVQAQMQKRDYHAFPSVVDNYGSFGTQTTFQGGDGNMYTKLAIPGSYHGKDGFFVYIWNSFGQCNHRLFEVSY